MNIYLHEALKTAYISDSTALPLKFKNNTDLGLIQKRISDQILVREIPKFRDASNIESSTLFKSAVENLPDVQSDIGDLIHGFATLLTSGFDNLKRSIAPEVESLVQEIRQATNEELGLSVDDQDNLSVDNRAHQFIMIDIDALVGRVGGVEDIVKAIEAHYEITLGEATYNNVLRANRIRITKVSDISSSLRVEIQQRLDARIKESDIEESRKDSIRESSREFVDTRNILSNIDEKFSVRSIPNLHDTVEKHIDNLEYIKDFAFGLPEEYQEAVKYMYTEFIMNINVGILYLHSVYHSPELDNVLLFTPIHVNAKQMEVFINEYDGTKEDLGNVVRVFYYAPSGDVVKEMAKITPMLIGDLGVSTKSIANLKDRAKETIDAVNESIERSYLAQSKHASAKMFAATLNSYIADFEEPLEGFDSVETMRHHIEHVIIPTLVRTLLDDDKASMENIIYQFVIDARYPKSIEKSIFSKLGTKYIELADNDKDMSDRNILILDLEVMIEIVFEYLIEHHMVIT